MVKKKKSNPRLKQRTLLYGIDGKSQSMIRISEKPNDAVLSWTHYLILIRIQNENDE